MERPNPNGTKVIITGTVTLFIFVVLLLEHFSGGVPSHHLLHQKDLPAISNWWSGAFLPVITWILLGRIEMRLDRQNKKQQQTNDWYKKIFGLFMIGLVFAVLIAVSFTYGYHLFLDNVIYFLLILSLIIPIYYPEFILGFILGMTFTFGAILPSIFILIFAVIGAIIYKFLSPMLIKLIRLITKHSAKSPNR